MDPRDHSPGLDLVRVIAAHVIVLHHLAIYTAMADAAWTLAPEVFRWLVDHGRKAVQVFLVMGGFLAARGLLPRGEPVVTASSPGMHDGHENGVAAAIPRMARLIAGRFLRLAPMVWLVLVVMLLIEASSGAAGRATAADGVAEGAPPLAAMGWRFVSNALLLQDVLGVPSMSAGLWYVGIDFQLYACVAALACLGPRSSRGVLLATVAAVLASAWVFNRNAAGDAWAPFFMASYGVGMLAWWAVRRVDAARAALMTASAGILAAMAFDLRDRLLIALVTAWLLVAMHSRRRVDGELAGSPAWQRQAGASYALFLLHYPVLLLLDATWSRYLPSTPLMQLAGVVVAWLAAWRVAMVVHSRIEPRLRLSVPS